MSGHVGVESADDLRLDGSAAVVWRERRPFRVRRPGGHLSGTGGIPGFRFSARGRACRGIGVAGLQRGGQRRDGDRAVAIAQ